MWFCLRRMSPPLGLNRGILNSSSVLILLIHTKHRYKNMKSWTDPSSSFPWRRTHALGRQGKKHNYITNNRTAAHKSWMVKCSIKCSEILAKAINTKILTNNHPDFPHSLPDSLHSHLDSLHCHPNFPRSHPDSPSSYHSPHFVPRFPIAALQLVIDLLF